MNIINLEQYPYIAALSISKKKLLDCCIKEATVLKINSPQTITIKIDSVEYENIQVYVHTDIGTRSALVKGVEQTVVSDYFKDAAFMFPFPKDIPTGQGTTLEPTVYAVVHKDDGALCVIGVKQSISSIFPDVFRTYRPFIKYVVSVVERFVTPIPLRTVVLLYDVIEDKIAEIPTYDNLGEPILPFLPALSDNDNTLVEHINKFTSSGVYLGNATKISRSPKGIVMHPLDPTESPSDFMSNNIYFTGVGLNEVYPAWEITSFRGNNVFSAIADTPVGTGSLTHTDTGDGIWLIRTESEDQVPYFGYGFSGTFGSVVTDLPGTSGNGSNVTIYSDDVVCNLNASNTYSAYAMFLANSVLGTNSFIYGSSVISLTVSYNGESASKNFTISNYDQQPDFPCYVDWSEAFYSNLKSSLIYSSHLSYWSMWKTLHPTTFVYNSDELNQFVVEFANQDAYVKSTNIEAAVVSANNLIKSFLYEPGSKPKALVASLATFYVPYDVRIGVL